MTNFFKQLFIFSLLFSLFIGCEKEDVSNCGCESVITDTIPVSAGLTGQLAYNKQLDSSDDFYVNKYWVTVVDSTCINCVLHLIVCNEDMLDEFNYIKNSEPEITVNVNFSGYRKKICKEIYRIPEVSYHHIVLTKIEEVSSL